MDHASFHSLSCRLKDATFSDDKLAVLNSSHGYFGGDQLHQVLHQFAHDSDKLKAVQALQGRLCSMTCAEAARVLEASSFSNSKLEILEAIACNICDATSGGHVVQAAFTFSNDKTKAMEILNRHSGGGGGYPSAHVGYPSAPPQVTSHTSHVHVHASPFAPPVPGPTCTPTVTGPGPDLGGMMSGMGAVMGAAMGATVQGANAMAQAMGAGFNQGLAATGVPPPYAGTYPGTYPGQAPPPAPGAGYPPPAGMGYPPTPGSGYPQPPGQGYPY